MGHPSWADSHQRPVRMPSRTALDQSRSAAERIVQSAITLAVARGVAHVSLQDVAEEAGVSKGLIHYHFHDRETLLARLAEALAVRTVSRQRAALQDASIGSAVDDLWAWVDEELRRGQIRVLIELGREPGELPRRAAREAATVRREAAAVMITELFSVLELTPRLPVPLLADVITAFVDGLVVRAALEPQQELRTVFDAFWLSVLSLAE